MFSPSEIVTGFKDRVISVNPQLKANQQMSIPPPTQLLKMCWLPYLPTYGFQPLSVKKKNPAPKCTHQFVHYSTLKQ